ncbi:MAG TPA: hypothetical protein DCQ14_01005 [Firmicutes bacterium]|nr:hypothetical protein [Bacillota bacterium]
MPVKKKTAKKILYRNIFVSAVALILIAGLVLSAVLGFADFLVSGEEQTAPPVGEDYLSTLEDLAASLEETLAASPYDAELKMRLADLYLELAMAHGSLGAAESRDAYVQKGEALIQQAGAEFPEQHAIFILKLAILAAFYQDDAIRAERFFREALVLDGENAQAHLYYGIFLALRERGADARLHLEKVLALEPEGSELAVLARAYMEGNALNLPPSP